MASLHIIDPLGLSTFRSDHYFHSFCLSVHLSVHPPPPTRPPVASALVFVFRTDVQTDIRTDTMCEYNDHQSAVAWWVNFQCSLLMWVNVATAEWIVDYSCFVLVVYVLDQQQLLKKIILFLLSYYFACGGSIDLSLSKRVYLWAEAVVTLVPFIINYVRLAGGRFRFRVNRYFFMHQNFQSWMVISSCNCLN